MKHIYILNHKRFFLLLWFCCIGVFSQNQDISFTRLSVKDGLSQNGVMSIFKDSKGYVWLGTRDGLNRYDGYNFKVFRHNPHDFNSLSNNYINTIVEDKDGVLWVGTQNGLNAFNQKDQTFKCYKNIPTNDKSISDNKILSILISDNGDLWVGTENGLNVKKRHENTFTTFYNLEEDPNSISGNEVFALFEDSKNNIWVGTRYNGLNKFLGESQKFRRFLNEPSNPMSIRDDQITSIAESEDGKLWIGTKDNGISILDKNDTFTHIVADVGASNTLSHNRIRSLVFDEDSNVWIATYNGLSHYNTSTGNFTVYKNVTDDSNSISHNSIRSLFLDNSGLLWAGTYFGGVNIINLTSNEFIHFQHSNTNKNSLSYNVVGPMVEDQNKDIWIGTEGGGLNFFDHSKQTVSRITFFNNKPIIDKTIKSLLVDGKGNLWIGTFQEGLLVVNLDNNKLEKFTYDIGAQSGLKSNSILSLLEDHIGKIWIGTDNGLCVYNPKTKEIGNIQLPKIKSAAKNISITCICEDSNNIVWIGTKTNGLLAFDGDTIKQYTHTINNDNSISHNYINEIFEDSKNRIWIGTYGAGLDLINPEEETFKHYTLKDGLVNDIIYSIEEDSEKKLWVATPTGISKMNPEENSFKNYTYSNGIPIDELNNNSSLHHSSGLLFFGGFNGFMGFIPDHIKDNPNVPDITLLQLKLFNKTVKPNDKSGLLKTPLDETKSITFSHEQNIFSIDYIALNYFQPGQNQYAYKLEGLESDWNYVGNRTSATYTNLSPGDYTFKVKAANIDGIWNDKVISLNIIKRPPFWKTIWAYLIYLTFAFILFFIIRKYFLIKLGLENNLKLEKLEKNQIEKLTKLKLKFFTNISHEFRTPLTLIHAPLQELISTLKESKYHNQLLLIKKNADLMLRLINQLMDFRSIESGQVSLKVSKKPFVPFVKEVVSSFKEYAKSSDIRFSFTSSVSNDNFLFDKNKIEKVLYNLLSNAFKNTPEKGKVSVKISKNISTSDINFIEVSIYNSGVGIEKKDIERIFDRFYQTTHSHENDKLGSGVGLTMAKNLIELHKGYIHVNSKVNQYAEFTIGIPMEDVYSKEEKESASLSMESEKSSSSSSSVNVEDTPLDKEFTLLIVEDSHDLRNFLAQSFSADYNIKVAENGELGLQIASEDHIDIIISDIMMPKLSGIEMCKKIKSNPRTKHIPVILLTARTASTLELESYDTGADDFISKPFNIDVLKSKVRNNIKSKIDIDSHARQEIFLEDSEINNSPANEKFLKKLSDYIRDHISDPNLNVNSVSKELGLSRVHLYRKTKEITGKSPVTFIRDFRLSVATKLIEKENYNINEICYKIGFQDASYFRKCFKKKYKVSPSAYLEKIKTEEIN
ncbi:hybrid sensor histidine kinase/response regulator transcription factor [Flavivirga spongiicola]|uniref:histidine kinase n=1 Tax=Flavivirga spongiicola TaxID=421621 RepID=A0ABU7XW95_9FLAO|nr:two-component regulator propeller domain-containing protein [Flavivirga sp. MEBiC05379]MDO5980051.1 two-component regulator propeller domain-containing protein [Flavivirga sp. MEBiC05379]